MYSSLLHSINCNIYTPNFLYLGDLPIKNNHALSHKVAPPLSALMLVSLAHYVCVRVLRRPALCSVPCCTCLSWRWTNTPRAGGQAAERCEATGVISSNLTASLLLLPLLFSTNIPCAVMSSLGFLLCVNLTSSFFLSQALFGFTGILKPRLSTIKQPCFLFVSNASLSSSVLQCFLLAV